MVLVDAAAAGSDTVPGCLLPWPRLAAAGHGSLLEPGQGLDVSGGGVAVLPHQRHQRARRPRLPQEGVVQQLHGGGALGGVPHQHLVQEPLQLRGHLRVLQLGRRHVADPPHGLQRRLVEEGRLPVHHLYHHDAQGPDVHVRPVRQPGDDLGRHPVGRAHQGLPLGQVLAHLGAEPEVGQLDVAVSREEDGVTLDVSVDDALAVEVGQRLETHHAHGGDLLLGHAHVGDDVGEGAALQVLHHHPELVLHQVAVVHLHDVGVVIVPHDHHLVEEQLPPLLLPQVHPLDRHLAARLVVGGDADDAGAALADLDEVLEV